MSGHYDITSSCEEFRKDEKVYCFLSMPSLGKKFMPKEKMIFTIHKIHLVFDRIYLSFNEVPGETFFPVDYFKKYDTLSEHQKKEYDLFYFHVN